MIKTDWIQHLQKFRYRELEIAFKHLESNSFGKGLELGAGDGFQSKLLIQYIDHLIATDLNDERLSLNSTSTRIEYIILDAEEVKGSFAPGTFDIVYSSNLMEHLPNVRKCFKGIYNVLKDDGIALHIMPSPGWRFFATLLHFPNKFANILMRISNKTSTSTSSKKGNNLKVKREKGSRVKNFFIPKPHGISSNFISEFFAFSKSKWIKDFEATDFEIVKIVKGPVSSGYGFGFDRIRKFLEKIGVATEYIYIVKKKKAGKA